MNYFKTKLFGRSFPRNAVLVKKPAIRDFARLDEEKKKNHYVNEQPAKTKEKKEKKKNRGKIGNNQLIRLQYNICWILSGVSFRNTDEADKSAANLYLN